MTIAQEMFRFVNVRQPRRVAMHRITSRLIRDRRPVNPSSMLVTLFGPGDFGPKLREADAFAAGPLFIDAFDPEMLALEPAVDFFRARLQPGVVIADLAAAAAVELPLLSALLERVPPAQLVEATNRFLGREWDSLYAQTIRGCDRYVSTNHLIDGLRVYQILRLLWLSLALGLTTWAGGAFDDYDTLIDLDRARAGADGSDRAALPAAGPNGRAEAAAYRVPLTVGEVPPPSVGDLLLVEQELRRYELSELMEITSIMKGERRERSIRNLARTSSTTTTETSSEVEETTSLKTDERFQLSSQAQQTATENFGVQVGVTVSGKFGPVQVGASANASFDTSTSTSESTAQEYARTVTEEATKRVKNSIKETTSVTILTETQDTSLHGFNNEKGEGHINGLYRWVDKIYTARLLNYGRRLMLPLRVPEPSAFYHALLAQPQATAVGALEEPLHPSRINRITLDPLDDDVTEGGIASPEDVSEDNYAELAARYDVSGLPAPPPESITGSKAIVYPEAMQAAEIKEHDHPNDLSYVTADNTLALDPGYKLTEVGVFAPTAPGGFASYADALKLGFDNDEANVLLVQVGDQSFHFTATGHGNDPRTILTDFNTMVPLHPSAPFTDAVESTLPITVTANFEGIMTFTVVYSGTRRDEVYEDWKGQTYAAILKGYTAKKQAYDQARGVAQAQGQAAVETQTFQLREDQYRAIELAELKRGCVDLLSAGTAAGHTSIRVADDGTPTIVYEEADAAGLTDWRSPLANGAVADFFDLAFEWESVTYTFHPYHWAAAERWKDLALAAGADPVFEQFLRSGSAAVVLPVRPGYERPVLFFLKTGLVWGGGYLSLFTSPDMLAAYADVEQGVQLDPPEQIGDSWEIRVPTSMAMLQEDATLPEFPPAEEPTGDEVTPPEPTPDETVPF